MINLNVSIANTRFLIRFQQQQTKKKKKEKNPKTFSLCNCQWIASWMHVKKRLECTSCQKVKIGKKNFLSTLYNNRVKNFHSINYFLCPIWSIIEVKFDNVTLYVKEICVHISWLWVHNNNFISKLKVKRETLQSTKKGISQNKHSV